MAKIAVIKTGEQYFANCIASNKHIKLDKFIFANVPYVTGNTAVNVNGTLPTASQIKHTASVTQSGLISDNAVVYSVVLDSTIGDFEFNYIGLMNSETNTLCMVLHTDIQRKLKTQGQQQGNTLTESLWLEIDGAAQATGITVNAETWMIDYSARMAGEDERIRLSNLDHYGRLAVHSGFNITYNTEYTINPGVAYVAGLRVEHIAAKSLVAQKGESIYIDAWLSGTVTGAWSVNYKIVVGVDFTDYKDGIFQHYVEKIATISEPGVIQKPNIYSVVNSVNGESGQVTVTPQKINAVSKDGDTMSNTLTITTENALRLKSLRNEISSIIRFDGTRQWFLFTNKGDPNGNYNNLRPINIHSDTGTVDIGHSLTIGNIPALKQGDYGLGASTLNNNTNIDIDSHNFNTGFYSGNSWSASKNQLPFGKTSTTDWFYLLNQNLASEGFKYKLQILGHSSTKKIAFRNWINGVPHPFIEFITTENLNTHIASYPIGAPIDWFSDVMPDDGRTYLYLDGSAFDKTKYPELAKVFPNGKLPDVRGVVRRGMDNGRGLDPNRVLGSYQDDAIRNITGTFTAAGGDPSFAEQVYTGAFTKLGDSSNAIGSGHRDQWGIKVSFDASKDVPTANENRMKNIACHVITRAN